jgi:hypothetical protein
MCSAAARGHSLGAGVWYGLPEGSNCSSHGSWDAVCLAAAAPSGHMATRPAAEAGGANQQPCGSV